MQRNTQTTLANLRTGDRFHFINRADVWQVTYQTQGYTAVNQFMPWKTAVHPHDHLKKNSTPVKFLRHTKPQPGDDAMLNDLTAGDVFWIDNSIDDYTVMQPGYPKVICRCSGVDVEMSNMEWVTLIRKAQEATV